MPGTDPISFSIDALNRATRGQATAMMDRIVERSTWLAQRASDARPFDGEDDLAAWLTKEVRGLSKDDAIHLLCAHPELSPPDPSVMTSASQSEQVRLDLLNLNARAAAQLAELNRRYLRRHGYPFIIALHEFDSLTDVLVQFERRIAADPEEERARALGQIISVMKARLAKLTGTSRHRASPKTKVRPRANTGGPSQ